MKFDSFYTTTTKNASKLKRPPTEWEKIFTTCISDKGLITRIYRELKELNFPKFNNLIKKWANK
jgi:hypothetical protein